MKRRLHRNLFPFIGLQLIEFWPYYLSALLCLWGTHWVQSHLPFLTQELADLVGKKSAHIKIAPFLWLALGTIVLRTLSRLLFFYPARVLQKEIRTELVDQLEKANPSRYENYNDGQIFQILSRDMEELRALVGFALLQVGNIIVALLVLVPKLNAFNSSLTMALIPLVLAFLLFSFIVSKNHLLYRQTQDLQGEVQNVVIESYLGKKTIKNFHAEKSFIHWFQDYSWRELKSFYKAGIRVGISTPFIPLGVGLSLLWGAAIIKESQLGASTLILFSSFIFLLLEPMMFVSWIGVVFSRSYGAWCRIKELVQLLHQSSPQEKALMQRNSVEQVEKQELNLEFWNHSLKIKHHPGRWTVLVGPTGCGKSYLLTQIADLFTINKHSVTLVHQTPYLYNDTIEKNIFLGRKINLEEKNKALKLLKLFALNFITEREEDLLKLEVGENGRHLSGGQIKRVGLIRSLMGRSNIILWDDPFSSVDLILEKQIINQLKELELLKTKTIILTSHRMSTAKACEHLILLDKEQGIVEEGPVSQLLKLGQKTYAYFKKQMV